ncbi:protein Nazo-like [Chironomus tepperi]|uniref:protein Nazo-like n=1 Tax=Chironomus tepperi TaxID=113505 RepID=UPI00391FA0A5
MPVNTRELIDAVSIIAEQQNLRVTVTSSFKASCTVAGTTMAASVLFGPVGIVLGAAAGSMYAYSQARGTFRSAAVIIRDELTEEQKDKLCQHIVDAFNEVRPEEIAMLIPLLLAPGQFQTLAMTKVVGYLRDELNMRISS